MSADPAPVSDAARSSSSPNVSSAGLSAARPPTSTPAEVPVSGKTPSAEASRAVTLRPPERVDVGYDARELRRQLEEAIEQLNEQARRNGRDLNFRVDDVVDRTVITVRSKQTGEVVRQIPSETVLRVAHSIEDMKGLLLNETV